MPNLTLTNPTLTNPADKSEIETNFSDITTLLNGGLDNDNFIAAGGLATSKLAAQDYEFLVNLEVKPTTAVQPGTSSTLPIAVVALPGDTSDGVSYTPLSASYYITDDGTGGNTTFNVELGHASGGSWTQVGSDVISATSIAGGSVGQVSGDATNLSTAALALHASDKYFLALFLTAVGTAALDTAYSLLSITIKLRRTDGLRGT